MFKTKNRGLTPANARNVFRVGLNLTLGQAAAAAAARASESGVWTRTVAQTALDVHHDIQVFLSGPATGGAPVLLATANADRDRAADGAAGRGRAGRGLPGPGSLRPGPRQPEQRRAPRGRARHAPAWVSHRDGIRPESLARRSRSPRPPGRRGLPESPGPVSLVTVAGSVVVTSCGPGAGAGAVTVAASATRARASESAGLRLGWLGRPPPGPWSDSESRVTVPRARHHDHQWPPPDSPARGAYDFGRRRVALRLRRADDFRRWPTPSDGPRQLNG